MAKIKTAEEITFKINGEHTPGYLAVPEASAPVPGVIVIQEVWGLNDDIKRIARMFAEAGYAALSPDLYHGNESAEMEEARKFAMAMQKDRAAKDIDAAIRYLKALPEVQGSPVAMIGFCMGGGLTLETAIRGGDIAVGACFYGGTQTDLQSVGNISIPIFCAFGADDHLITLEQVEDIRKALQTNNIDHELRVYQGAGHSFFNEVKPDWYRSGTSQEAWEHVRAFFDRALQKQSAAAST